MQKAEEAIVPSVFERAEGGKTLVIVRGSSCYFVDRMKLSLENRNEIRRRS